MCLGRWLFRQDEGYARPAKAAAKKMWATKNPLDFFYVCPLMLHERITVGDDGGRPVYRFVFSCPGKAGALVRAVGNVF